MMSSGLTTSTGRKSKTGRIEHEMSREKEQSAMELKTCITTRRSIRKYLPDPIPHELLEELLEGAVTAPSGVNNQPWYFVALETREAVEAYRELMRQNTGNFRRHLEERFPNHPEVVESTLEYLSTLGSAPTVVLAFLLKPEFNRSHKSNPALQSVAAAIENLLLLAWDKGIGSCWMTAPFSMGVDEVLEATYAPGHGQLVAAVAMGYPAQEPKMPRRREGRIVFL